MLMTITVKMHIYESDVYLMKGHGGGYYVDDTAYHRGTGIGSIFHSIFSSIVPFVKSAFRVGSKTVGKALRSDAGRSLKRELKRHATSAALNVASDALQGKNVLASSKKNVTRVSKEMGKHIEDISRKNLSRPSQAKKKKISLAPTLKVPLARSRKRGSGGGVGMTKFKDMFDR